MFMECISMVRLKLMISDVRCKNVVRIVVFLFKQKTAYEMRISDWSSDVCSSDLTGEIKSKGFEFEAAMEMPGNFQLTAAYSYNDAEVTSSLYTYEVGERVNDVPQHMASAWGVKTVPLQEDMALRVGAGVRYIGNTVSTGTTTVLKTPGYTLVDGMVALDWNRWTAAINATNLFDKSYYSKCRPLGDCFNGTRRPVSGSLKYRF